SELDELHSISMRESSILINWRRNLCQGKTEKNAIFLVPRTAYAAPLCPGVAIVAVEGPIAGGDVVGGPITEPPGDLVDPSPCALQLQKYPHRRLVEVQVHVREPREPAAR